MRGEKYEPVSPVCYWFYGSILLCITDQRNNQVKVQFNNKLQPFINVSAGEFINKKENRFITYEKKILVQFCQSNNFGRNKNKKWKVFRTEEN